MSAFRLPASGSRLWVKFCGITRQEDLDCAVECGVDAVGLMLYPPSKRALSVDQAAALAARLPAEVASVIVVVDPEPDELARLLDTIMPDMVQFHGDEPPGVCGRLDRPYLKAVRMRDDVDVAASGSRYPGAAALLLDTYRDSSPGGTGEAFDWTRVPSDPAVSVVLAGGLTPENVARAVHQAQPHGVDVSGGIETAAGIKDPKKMQRFIEEVNRGRN